MFGCRLNLIFIKYIFIYLEIGRQERSADQATRQVRPDRRQRRLERGQRVCPQVHQQRVHRKLYIVIYLCRFFKLESIINI